jgi:hypothetical protein
VRDKNDTKLIQAAKDSKMGSSNETPSAMTLPNSAMEILTFFLFLFLDEPERGFWTGKEKLYYLTRPPT